MIATTLGSRSAISASASAKAWVHDGGLAARRQVGELDVHGPDVVVEPFAIIGPGVTVGDGTTVGPRVIIERDDSGVVVKNGQAPVDAVGDQFVRGRGDG